MGHLKQPGDTDPTVQEFAGNYKFTGDVEVEGTLTGDIAATAGSIDTDELAADAVDGTKIEDDAVDSEHIAAGALDPEHFSSEANVEVVRLENTDIANSATDSISPGATEACTPPTITTPAPLRPLKTFAARRARGKVWLRTFMRSTS